MRPFIVCILGSVLLAGGAAVSSSAAIDGTPTAQQIVARLRAAGLPIGRLKVYDQKNDANQLLGQPGEYTGKVNFHDSRIRDGSAGFAVSSGGSVEVFASNSDAKRRLDFIAAATWSPVIFAEYDYRIGAVILRLSHRLTRAQARRYAATVRRLVQPPASLLDWRPDTPGRTSQMMTELS